jgi:uncharacterized protein with PIN domain
MDSGIKTSFHYDLNLGTITEEQAYVKEHNPNELLVRLDKLVTILISTHLDLTNTQIRTIIEKAAKESVHNNCPDCNGSLD